MSGLNALTAAEHVVEIGGKAWRLAPLTLADYGAIENRIIAGRPDPIEVAKRHLPGLDARQQEVLLARALDAAAAARRASIEEIDAFRRTPEGIVFVFWLAASKHHGDLSLEDARELLGTLADEERRRLAAGVEACLGVPLGKPAGQPR